MRIKTIKEPFASCLASLGKYRESTNSIVIPPHNVGIFRDLIRKYIGVQFL